MWRELGPVLIDVVLLAGHRRMGDLMVKSAVQFHGSGEQTRRAESRRSLARAIAAVAGIGFILLGLIDLDRHAAHAVAAYLAGMASD